MGRKALQQSAPKSLSQKIRKIFGQQATFNHRARMCTLFAQGKWASRLENK